MKLAIAAGEVLLFSCHFAILLDTALFLVKEIPEIGYVSPEGQRAT